MKKLLYRVFIILLIVIIAISSYFIYKELKRNKEQNDTFEDLIEIVEDEKSDIDLLELYEQNNDLIGWVKIEDTNVNYPIMQTVNSPNYYLRKDFYKKYSTWGTPYLAESCSINTSENLVIYGHHINGNKMFGELEKYKNQEFYENHNIIKFYYLNENLETIKSEYEIFAVIKTTLYKSNTFKYYQYIELDNESIYSEFIDKCRSIAFYNTNLKVEYKDKLLTLSTCEYSTKNSRLVVVARLKN